MAEIIVATRDGTPLVAQEFPVAGPIRAVVVVAPAMGVDARFYHAFCEWLAARDFWVMTFDYRGTGRSLKGPLRRVKANLTTWAEQDCAAMVALSVERAQGRPVLWVGHSLGGQLFGMIPNRQQVSALLTVACGTGYWLHNVWELRVRVWVMWYLVVPVLLALYGYFPGRRLGMVGDLPGGVMEQWRRWCLVPDYMVEAEGLADQYAGVKQPICSLSFTDDEMMSRTNIERLHALYSGAPRDMRRIQPSDISTRRIGHFGFFRRQFSDTLWPLAARWLAEHGEKV